MKDVKLTRQENTFTPVGSRLQEIFGRLYDSYGPQHWWPGDGPFEMIVGAILTQNTAWTNADKAISNLKKAKALNPAGLRDLPQEDRRGPAHPDRVREGVRSWPGENRGALN